MISLTNEGDEADMKYEALCMELLRAEDENHVVEILDRNGFTLDNNDIWEALGQNEGNFSTIGNQQEEGTAALVEKIVNSVDAVLLSECHAESVDPEGADAPQSMQEAVERFLGVNEGRIDNLSGREQGLLAEKYIHVVATGDKRSPCYCVVDKGEGQTPNSFKNTFLSTTKSSPKIKIPFVQGKFNAGGTGSLQFCGQHNIQLIISKRNPDSPTSPDDSSNNSWGFTVIRRKRPESLNERSSVFKYLAPNGKIPRFEAVELSLLPGKSSQEGPGKPYDTPINYGTCVKLYNYRWPAVSTATLEAKRELERYFQLPCMPFRVHETRDYKAKYFATTVSGVWNTLREDEPSKAKHEEGFPADLEISLREIGHLPVRILVWKEEVRTKDVPTGVFFLVNGQVHGQFSKDFISRTLNFDYIKDHLLVAVDCTSMNRVVAEDLFMASRDRLRRNNDYYLIRQRLREDLSEHPGLKSLNAEWRRRRKEKAIESKEDVTRVFDQLLKKDPSLAKVLNLGGLIPSGAGPGEPEKFNGRRFPTYFRLLKEPKGGLIKPCPVNSTVKVEFETDADNDYFFRPDERGVLTVEPSLDLIVASRLWNGRFLAKFEVPWDGVPGDRFEVKVSVTDDSRLDNMDSSFTLVAEPPEEKKPKKPGKPKPPVNPKSPNPKLRTPQIQVPEPVEVRKADWGKCDFDPKHGELEAIKIKNSEEGYDFFINVDNKYLINEMAIKKNDPDLLKQWFKWGLTITTLGIIINETERLTQRGISDVDSKPDLEKIGQHGDGIARIVIPLIRSMNELELAKLS